MFANPVTPAASTAASAADAATTSGSGTSSTADTATISANDFLQLLVTELQNQDPTADTDPNEYINQLVQVNSLEQLIQINQELTPSSSSATVSATEDARVVGQDGQAATLDATTTAAPGNLSAPAANGSAARIADALGAATQALAPGGSQGPLDSVLTSLRARAQQARTSLSNPAH